MPLFKYLHPDRTDVLRHHAIRFSSPLVLNDPFELKPHLARVAAPEYMEAEITRMLPMMVREELIKMLPPELHTTVSDELIHALLVNRMPEARTNIQQMENELMPKMQESMAKKFEELLGILCLTEKPDNLLMWAHYADSHRGFVIKFDEKSDFFDRRVAPDDELRHLCKVTYSSKRPSLTLSEVENFSSLLTKGDVWEYEAEWRMVVTLDSASRIIGAGPKAIHLFDFPHSSILSVALGCQMDPAKKDEIKTILGSDPNYSHVQCIEAEICNEHYRVLT